MAIKFSDSFDYFSSGQMKQLTLMQQVMKDVKTSVEYSWPGVECTIQQSYNSTAWEIVLSKMAGGQICSVKDYITDLALQPLSDSSKGIWIIQEVISKMIQQLDKAVAGQMATQPPMMNLYGLPEAVSMSMPTQSSFQPKYYYGGNSSKITLDAIFKTEAPKVESLEDMYDKAPVEAKKKKSKSKVKL